VEIGGGQCHRIEDARLVDQDSGHAHRVVDVRRLGGVLAALVAMPMGGKILAGICYIKSKL
jgi:hypothetical protein